MLIPLHNNVWGVTLEEEQAYGLIKAPWKEKLHYQLLVVAVGPKCKYVKEGDVCILPMDTGGSTVTIMNEDGTFEHRYCMNEERILAVWRQEEHPTEEG